MQRILIVDDQVDIQEILADYLRNNGYYTEAVGNGTDAIQFLKKKNFSLIITDLMMPKGDGFTLIEDMKKASQNTPILIITGGGNLEKYHSKIKELEQQNYTILKKPFSQGDLKAAIMNAL